MKYLFTTSVCPKCVDAKQYVEDHPNMEITILVVDKDPVGMELARKYGIGTVPMFVFHDDTTKQILTLKAVKLNFP